MRFNPCAGNCTQEGAHCEGCGRSHEEIRGTSALVNELVSFMQKMGYENPEEFAGSVTGKAVKRFYKTLEQEA